MKIDQKYINQTKKTLKSYKLLKNQHDEVKEELKALNGFSGLRAINYNNTRVTSSGVNKSTENSALNKLEKEEYLNKKLERYKHKMSILELAIDGLLGDKRDVLDYRYLQGMRLLDIVDKMFISERTIQNITIEAIRDLAVIMYGTRVFVKKEM